MKLNASFFIIEKMLIAGIPVKNAILNTTNNETTLQKAIGSAPSLLHATCGNQD